MTLGNFWKDFDECQREVRASMRVVALRHDTTAKARVRSSRQSLAFAAMNVEWMAEAAPEEITQEDLEAFDRAASKVNSVCARLRMKRSTAQLCEQFGRAP